MPTLEIVLKLPHQKQNEFITDENKRKVVRAGRRGGKTIGASIKSITEFLNGKRVLYTAPTSEQTDAYWTEISNVLAEAITAKVYVKNEATKTIEKPGTTARIKAKTAWNADTLRGDYADLIIFDEWQMTNEDAWEVVGQPMLLDNNGDAIFIYTPPSLISMGISKARDPRHAAKMFKEAEACTDGRWKAYHFTSWDNPYISHDALASIAKDMSQAAYRQEILAEDDEVQTSWLVYRAWNEILCKKERFTIPQNWPVYSGHDFGLANPAALFIAQNPGTGDFFCFQEYTPGSGKSTNDHVESFRKIIKIGENKYYNVLKSAGGNYTTEDEIRQGYTAHGWPIMPPKWAKPGAQMDKVRGLMEMNKLFIFNDMVELLSEIANCIDKLDETGKPTNEIKNESKFHLLSCLRYIACGFTPETELSRRVIVRRFS